LVKGLPQDSAYSRWLQNKENRSLVESSEDLIFEEMKAIKQSRNKQKGR